MSQPPQADPLLRIQQVLALVPISRSGWWQGVKDHRYPQPIKLSPRVTVWRASDIQVFIDGIAKTPTPAGRVPINNSPNDGSANKPQPHANQT